MHSSKICLTHFHKFPIKMNENSKNTEHDILKCHLFTPLYDLILEYAPFENKIYKKKLS